jgi:hypothetical protein
MILFGFLAFPWSKEQPTELFLASRIRFLIKPRKRIWDQSGVKDLVNVTVPVREAHIYSDGLSQGEVRKRFNALATIVDSRGWAVKNVADSSDRLVSAPIVPTIDDSIMEETPDMFDESSGTIARQFDSMINESEKHHKSETMQLIEDARKKASSSSTSDATETAQQSKAKDKPAVDKNNQDFWFLHNQPQPNDPSLATFQSSTVVTPGATSSTASQAQDDSTAQLSEEELLEKVHKKQARDALRIRTKHEKVIDPSGQQKPTTNEPTETKEKKETISTMTPPSNPDIINLAQSNDLSVETLSRQANKKKDFGDDEVVISLH